MNIRSTDLGRTDYERALAAQEREKRPGEIQILFFEPNPVITLGLRADPAVDVNASSSVPILRVNRGGEATYHGPGQLVLFPILHLPELRWSVRDWVRLLVESTAEAVSSLNIPARADLERPGVYTNRGKIASVGLKIQKGWSFHGLAINLSEEVLTPFSAIRACGVRNAAMDSIESWRPEVRREDAVRRWIECFDLKVRRSQERQSTS